MNIYEKLSKARLLLQQSELKKSGHNKNLNFSYMELEDFLPRLNEINAEVKLLPMFNVNTEKATLTIIDIEKPSESITFESHTAEATLKGGAAPIQELGSQHTYMRRYMYILSYEITEKDTLDPVIGEKADKAKPDIIGITEKQVSRLLAIAKSKGVEKSNVEKEAHSRYKVTSFLALTKSQYDELVKVYEV